MEDESERSQTTGPITNHQNIIVIQPGSMYLKIGRASDLNPHVELHAIARKRYPNGTCHVDTLLPSVSLSNSNEIEAELDGHRLQVSHALQSCVMSDGQKRYATPPQQISQYNKRARPEVLSGANAQWRKTNVETVVGNDVLYLKEDYNIHYPIRRGDFNVHSAINGSLTSVLADIEYIWSYIIEHRLNISLGDLKSYKAVVVIPDVYNRQYLKELLNVVLDMGFESAFLLQDHVAATFGAGIATACVVDCGHMKTSVSCVEDAISHAPTRVRLPYGGGDITQCFFWLLNRGGFPYKECNSSNPFDALLLEKLKQECCHVNLDVCGCQEKTFIVRQPVKPVLKYTIQIGDECMIAPLGLFYPELFCRTVDRLNATQARDTGDSSDPHDAEYLRESRRKVNKEAPEATGDINDEEMVDIDTSGDIEFSIAQSQSLGLDQAVLQSVQRCGSDDLKRKMFSTILIVGGGLKFKGIATWLKNRLNALIPRAMKPDQIDIIVNAKDMDPSIIAWKGATILACLESAQELWITKDEFDRFGVKIMRERSVFPW